MPVIPRFIDEPRDWARPWVDHPGLLPKGKCCCAAAEAGYMMTGFISGANSGRVDSYVVDSYTNKTSAPSPARSYSASFVVSGAAYVATGLGPGNISDNDQYDPDTWTSKTNIVSPARDDATGFYFSTKGHVLGGIGASRLQDNDEYDPSGDSWTSKTDMPTPGRQTLSGRTDGTTGFVFGGNDGSGQLNDVDAYDPVGNSWTSKGAMTSPSRQGAASALISGKIYIMYGTGPGGLAGRLRDADEYTPGSDTWANKTDGPTPARTDIRAFTLSGAAYCTGGLNSTPVATADNDEYTPDTWVSKSDFTPARYAHCAETM
jgi:N-acetylneuraminic acid mutarotase